jgi:hypothetical protein
MTWFVFAYRVDDRPDEHELEEFASADEAQVYAVQNLALMLRCSDSRSATVDVGAASGARIRWLGGYEVEPESCPRWRSGWVA